MITSLTEEQKARMPFYVKKWTDIGRSTHKVDRAKGEDAMKRAYAAASPPLAAPTTFIWVPSPKEGVCTVYRLKNNLSSDHVLTKEQYKVAREEVYNAGYGNHDAGWLSFYDFFLTEIKLAVVEPLRPLIDLASNCNWYFPFTDVVVMCENPVEMHFNNNNQLHRDGGMALRYADGSGVWALNGVLVPSTYVLTPAEQIDPKSVLKEENAEVRRELVRKIGIVRLIDSLGAKVIDTFKGYELLTIDLGDDRHRPYLKMSNPSIEAIHVEGVHPDCKTVKEALAWRNGLKVFVNPIVLT